MRIVGNGTGGQAQGLDMLHLHQAVDGACHVFPVHEGVAAGNDDLFNQRRISDMFDRLPDILGGGLFWFRASLCLRKQNLQ